MKNKKVKKKKEIDDVVASSKLRLISAIIDIAENDDWDYDTVEYILNKVLDSFTEARVRSWCEPGCWNIFRTQRRSNLLCLTTLRLCSAKQIYELLRQWEPDETDAEFGWEYLRENLIKLLTENKPVEAGVMLFPLPEED